MSIARSLVAEALGTAILVGTVVGSGIMADGLSPDDGMALWGNTAATGAMLVVLILVFGPVSGAHFNPAVTLAFALRREIGTGSAVAYVVVQIAGGIAGAVLAHLMFDLPPLQLACTQRTGVGLWLSEGVATGALLLAIFGCLRYRPEAVPYAVGLVITAGYWWTASTSFANPAVTIARGLTDTFSGISPEHVAGFIAAQLVATVITMAGLSWLFAPADRDKPAVTAN